MTDPIRSRMWDAAKAAGRPMSAYDLALAVGVSPNNAAWQINRLIEAGHMRRRAAGGGLGRRGPRWLYYVDDTCREPPREREGRVSVLDPADAFSTAGLEAAWPATGPRAMAQSVAVQDAEGGA